MHSELDDKDRNIIDLLQKNPMIPQSMIAAEVGLSQPAVSLRVKRLTDMGFIRYSTGVDAKKLGMHIAKLDIYAKKPDDFIANFGKCPYIMDILHMDGKKLSILMAGEDISTIESVKFNLLGYDGVKKLGFDIIEDSRNGMVMSLCMVDGNKCDVFSCDSCENYRSERCLGCPYSGFYRGNLW